MEEFINDDNPIKRDSNNMMRHIEKTIQLKFNLYVPAIVFKLTTEGINWDYDDLYDVTLIYKKTLESFGEVDMLETNTEIAVVLYKKFLDAFATLEFLKDQKFYSQNNDSFFLRWYTKEDEASISKSFKRKIQSFIEKNKLCNKELSCNFGSNQQYMRSQNNFFQENISPNLTSKSPILSNLSYMSGYEMSNPNLEYNQVFHNNNFVNLNNHQIYKNTLNSFNSNNIYKTSQTPTIIQNQSPQYGNLSPEYNNINISDICNNIYMNNNINNLCQNENNFYPKTNVENQKKFQYNNLGSFQLDPNQSGKRKNSVNLNEGKDKEKNLNEKFTCKFEIQIENDNEFQICRKLIGSKGCNMKNIVDVCKNSSQVSTSEPVKLRLRGRGSGYKEGPEQKESEDSLHLCVSSKYQDTYYLACKLVEELINQIYSEYKIFMEKKGLNIPRLTVRRIEGESSNVNYSLSKNSSKKNTK